MAGKTVTVTDANFEEQVLKSDKPVMVDFWAPWCGPCRMVAPILDELATDFEGKAKIAKVNIDENQRYSNQYGVMAIPTMIIFKNGQEVERIQGARPMKSFYAEYLNRVIG